MTSAAVLLGMLGQKEVATRLARLAYEDADNCVKCVESHGAVPRVRAPISMPRLWNRGSDNALEWCWCVFGFQTYLAPGGLSGIRTSKYPDPPRWFPSYKAAADDMAETLSKEENVFVLRRLIDDCRGLADVILKRG